MFQCQDVYPELMEDLQKLVASPMVTENEFPSTFLSGKFYHEFKCLQSLNNIFFSSIALSTSGVETK